MLSAVNPSPVLTEMFQPLRGKAPFWPAEVANARIGKDLEVWGHISMKLLPAFIKASKVVYTEKELAELGCILPLRCLNLLFESLEPKIVAEAIVSEALFRYSSLSLEEPDETSAQPCFHRRHESCG